MEREGAKTIIVDKGPDSVDFKLLSVLKRGDIVITGDYGLAAMCIAKGGIVINHNGKELTSDNIDQLLAFRFESAKIRRAGGRTKGPKSAREKIIWLLKQNFDKFVNVRFLRRRNHK